MQLAKSLLVSCLLAPTALAQPKLLTVSPYDSELRRIDPATGATLSQVKMTIPGGSTISNTHGLAVDPTTKLLYALASVSGATASPKRLLRVDPVTGISVNLGNTGEAFAGMAFDSTGQLWGISGDGGNVPEALFKINKATAQRTFVKTLGAGGNGEALGFNPYDGLLYHASGTGPLNDVGTGTILETVHPTTLVVTPVTLRGFGAIGLTALGRDDSGTMISADFQFFLMKVTTAGTISVVGQLDHVAKGIAWVDGPSYFQPYGTGCPGSGGFTPALSGAGAPNPAMSTSLSISQGLGGAPALLFTGLGQGTANVVPACALQVMPIVPSLVVSLPLFGAGPGNGSLALPPVLIPDNATTIDLYLQLLVGDPGAAGGVASSAPLQMRIQ